MIKATVFYKFILLSMGLLAINSAVACEVKSQDLSNSECRRVANIVKAWNWSQASALKNLTVVKKSDQASDQLWCRFNADNDTLEVAATALTFSEPSLTKCLAQAVTQVQYSAIENDWLRYLAVESGWIFENQTIQAVQVEKNTLSKLDAQSLWAVLASQELVLMANPPSPTTTGRTIASNGAESNHGFSNTDIKKMLQQSLN